MPLVNLSLTSVSRVFCRSACIAIVLTLTLATSASLAQDGIFDTDNIEFSEVSLESELATTNFEGVGCHSCTSDSSCQQCGNCDACCGCRRWFGRCGPPWRGGFDIGLNGSAGDSRDANAVVGLNGKREVGISTRTIDIDYFFTRDDNEVTKNRLYALGSWERDIVGTPWNWFGDGWYEYDEFEDFKSRIGLHAGAAVILRETGCSKLKARFGMGTSKELEGFDNEWKPEALLGLNYTRTINERQKFKIRSDYYKDIGSRSSFRLNTRASWELLLDADTGLSFRISAYDRYDNTPSGSDQPNELDYWMSLHWGF
jgi:hypothetical protein